nr:hypothetical protein [Marinicella sp. W31]MDC2879113.1 hypothetical protein [Marinicella sp. W31]
MADSFAAMLAALEKDGLSSIRQLRDTAVNEWAAKPFEFATG